MFTSAVVAATLFSAVAYAQLTVNTPAALVTCQPAQLSWSGGVAPYFPSIIPGGQPSGAALQNFDQTSDVSLTWTVNLAAGTSITVKIVDSTGAINYSDQLSIQAGSSATCVGQDAAAAPAGAAGASSSPAGDATTTPRGRGDRSTAPAAGETGAAAVAGLTSTTSLAAVPAAATAVSSARSVGASVASAASAGVVNAASQSAVHSESGASRNAFSAAGLLLAGIVGSLLFA